jgi:zinc protease
MAKNPSKIPSAHTDFNSKRPFERQLSNGLPVVFQNYSGEVASIYWWIKTGSADERPHEAGFAHFLEHMHFKDTDAKSSGKASQGDLARAVESLGGDINAYTSFDQTVYHVTCAEHCFEKIVDEFCVLGKPQKFLKNDFEREREVILEELRKNEDTPSRQLYQSLFKLNYGAHPYGRPVIGYAKTLKAATVAQLEAFYRREYVSEKMGLIVVAPLTPQRVEGLMRVLEKRMGQKTLPRKKQVERPRPTVKYLQPKILSHTLEFDVQTPTLAMAWRTPGLGHVDLPAIDLAASLLGMGESSRLYQRLFYQEKLVTEVSMGLYVPGDAGMLYSTIDVPEVDPSGRAAAVTFEEIARLAKQGPSTQELDRVITNAESDKLYATQTADGLASRLGFAKMTVGDLHYDYRYIDELKSLDESEIQEAVHRYCDPARLSLVWMVPEGQKTKVNFEPIQAAAKKTLTATLPATKSRSAKKESGIAERPEVHVLPSGLKWIHHERTSSQVFSAHAASLGGVRLDRIEGLSNLLADTWTKGTPTKSSQDIAAFVEGKAAGMDGFSGRNTLGLSMTGLAKDWREMRQLFSEVLVDGSFPEDEVEHSRRVILDQIKGIEDHSSQLCSQLFLQTLFENHPYRHSLLGTVDSIPKIHTFELRKAVETAVRSNNLVITTVGRVKRSEVTDWVQSIDQKIQSRGRFEAATVSPQKDLVAPRWAERRMGREQIHIIVGGLGVDLKNPDRYALQLLSNILGGQSGRLFIELREKKSLAYSVSPIQFDGMERGYVGTYIACAPQKQDEATQGIRAVLEQFAAKGPSNQELKRAQEFMLGRRAMDLQSDSSLATHFGLEALYELPTWNTAEFAKKIRAISAKEIAAVCQRYLLDAHQVTCVVG